MCGFFASLPLGSKYNLLLCLFHRSLGASRLSLRWLFSVHCAAFLQTKRCPAFEWSFPNTNTMCFSLFTCSHRIYQLGHYNDLLASLWGCCLSVWPHFEFERDWKAPRSWVMWSEALMGEKLRWLHLQPLFSCTVCLTCLNSCCQAAAVDNASLLCWWLAAQALWRHTATLIAWAGHILFARNNKTLTEPDIV